MARHAFRRNTHRPQTWKPTKAPATWPALCEGEPITVQLSDGNVVEGRVETVHPQGDVVWVQLDKRLGRRLFHFQDDVTILAHA